MTVLSGDELGAVRNQAQMEVTRPLERGYVTDLGCQLSVWKRVCDVEGVGASPSPCPGAGGIPGGSVDPAVLSLMGLGGGGAPSASKKRATAAAAAMRPPPPSLVSRDCAVFLLTQPHTPRCVSERVDEVWFRDLGFARVGRRLSQTMAAYRYLSQLRRPRDGPTGTGSWGPDGHRAAIGGGGREERDEDGDGDGNGDRASDDGTRCCLVVDSGFSLTHVVPTVECRAVSRAVRRLNVGGNLMTNLLKEAVSYRQWNMMDEFPIMNDAKESLCFLSDDFGREMIAARNVRQGLRWFDRDFVLPNFVDTFRGEVRLSAPLQRERDEVEARALAAAVAKSKAMAAVTREDGAKKRCEGDGDRTFSCEDGKAPVSRGADSDEDGGLDSDEEDEEQRRQRILREKEEERRRRELEEQERQVLSLSVERFAVPEVLFRPSDIGLDQGGIAETIVQAVEACDPCFQAAMYQNVLLVGGNARLPGFRVRLEKELRTLAPTNHRVSVCLPDDPVEYAWKGACDYAQREDLFRTCCISRPQWEANKKAAWTMIEERHANDGMIII